MRIIFNGGAIRAVLIVLILAVLFTSLFKIGTHWDQIIGKVDSSQGNSRDRIIELDGVKYELRKDLKTILVIGVDKFSEQIDNYGYKNDQLADFISLMIIDEQNKKYSVLQLNRDTMTDIQVLGLRGEKVDVIKGQLALSHTYGSGSNDSCRNTVDAVEHLLSNIEIDHYIATTMDAVAILNDAIGGVTVTLLDDFTFISPEMTKGATVTLMGDAALSYVRARGEMADNTNIARMERQRQYLTSMRTKLLNELDEDNFETIFKPLLPYVVTDCTVHQLKRLFDTLSECSDGGIVTPVGTSVKGEKYMEFYPDMDALKQNVVDIFFTEAK